MEHLGVLKNSLKRVRAFQIELEFGRVGFYRGKPEYSDKNLSEQGREPTKKTQPTYGSNSQMLANYG